VDGGAAKRVRTCCRRDKFPRGELIRALLEPSQAIAVGYGTTIVEMKSGEEVQGVVKEATADAIELMGADGKRVRIPTTNIKEQRGSTVSLMPEGLQAGLSREEFTDLIEYLVTLKQPESALTSNRGMPARISELAKPIALRPFFDEQLRFPHAFVEKPGDIRSGLIWFGQLPGKKQRVSGRASTGRYGCWKSTRRMTPKLYSPTSQPRSSMNADPTVCLGWRFTPAFEKTANTI